MMAAGGAAAAEPAVRGGTTGRLPLTEAQLGIWYAQRLDPGNPIFGTGQYLAIRGNLDPPALRRAVAAVCAAAPALSARFHDDEDGPTQTPGFAPIELEIVDLRGRDAPRQAGEAWIAAEIATARDPIREPLTREVLLVVGDREYLWYQRIHHLVCDGYGVALLSKAIREHYGALVRGAAPNPEPFGSLDRVVAEDAQYRRSDRRAADREYWLAALADAPEVDGLGVGAAMTAATADRAVALLPHRFSEALGVVAERSDAGWPDVLVALTAAYLHRHVTSPEVVVGVVTAGRLGSAAARVPAMVMDVMPVRIAVDEDRPLGEYLKGVAGTVAAGRRHARYRGEQIRRDLGLLGGTRRLHGPVINVLPFDDGLELPDLDTTLHRLQTGPVDDLTISIRAGRSATVELTIEANPRRYHPGDAAVHAARLAEFLERGLEAARLAEVATLSREETERWAASVGGSSDPVVTGTLVDRLDAAMGSDPAATALELDGIAMSYADLDARTRALAVELTVGGVGRGEVVAVALPRSFELVIAIVAILRAGGTYLPIDPDHPPERIRRLLDSARPRLLLARSGLDVDASIPLLPPDRWPVAAERSVRIGRPGADDAAYLIYTSGSTGEPKGVVIEHRAIVNRLEWMRVEYGVTATDRILHKTPVTFDVSVWELLLPLLAGATMVIAPPDAHRDPGWLAELVGRNRVTVAHFVPSMLSVFLSDPAARGLELRHVFVSGEALTAELRDRFHRTVRARLHNLYGPTEAAVDVTFWDASRDDRSDPVPIGRPVWNTRAYVLDSRLRPTAPGVVGDLYLAGVQLARHYHGRPDLTAAAFVADPFRPGARMYRTGDLASRRNDGVLLFHGRADRQVKIRGIRVELGEVEAALVADPDVSQVAVVAPETSAGDRRIIGYVVPADASRSVDPDRVTARLALALPPQLIPSALVPIDSLPLTASGKVDLHRLPAVEPSVPGRRIALETETERRVEALFQELLGPPRLPYPPAADLSSNGQPLSADADFFALGGHSLLAARLVTRLRSAGHSIGLGAIFANPSIRGLAALLDRTAPGSERQGFEPLIRLVDSPASITPPLFCIHPAGGLAWCYGRLGRVAAPGRRVYGVQAPGLDPVAPAPGSIDQMATRYVELIRETGHQGPYHLLGWSVGGIIAQAMAVRLEELGLPVGVLALLDSYPADRWRNEPPPDERAVLRALLLIAGEDPDRIGAVAASRDDVIQLLRERGSLLAELPVEGLAGVARSVEQNARLVRGHSHRRYSGGALFFRAALDHGNGDVSPSEWAPYLGALDVHQVAALHSAMTGDVAAAVIGRVVAAAIGEVECA